MTRLRLALALLGVLLVLPSMPARAQLARLYCNVTSVRTRRIANAVQIVVQTDGTVNFGADLADFTITRDTRTDPIATLSLRIRLLGARTQLPTFVDIGAYPVDSVITSAGNEPLRRPFFADDAPRDSLSLPKVDLQFRFYVPVTVAQFSPSADPDDGLSFHDPLQALDVSVRLGPDRRSIYITVLSDRVEADRGAARLKRSSPQSHKHALSVTPGDGGEIGLSALHTPLSDVVAALGAATNTPIAVRADAIAADVTASLPSMPVEKILAVLGRAYGLAVRRRTDSEGGGFELARGSGIAVTERIGLKNISPKAARLLLPDFLLPSIRTDSDNNALVVTAPQEIVDRIRVDLEKLDTPRPQVKITASVYEFSTARDARNALSTTFAQPSERWVSTTDTLTLALGATEISRFEMSLDTLVSSGRVKVLSQPSLIVASGAEGTIFGGQDRFALALRVRRGVQDIQAIRLPIGTQLSVTPFVGADGDILLELRPRVTFVESIEAGTGLPTISLREASAALRIRSGDTIVVGTLAQDSDARVRRRSPLSRLPIVGPLIAPLVDGRRSAVSETTSLIVVRAERVDSSGQPITPDRATRQTFLPFLPTKTSTVSASDGPIERHPK